MNWITYHIPPIDYGWEQLKSVRETLVAIVQAQRAAYDDDDVDIDRAQTFLKDWRLAQIRAKASGWEGDFNWGPCVFWLPAEVSFNYGFVFKQTNNGCTFIVSPEPLPWLDSLKM